jgi:WD40 repeat protein
VIFPKFPAVPAAPGKPDPTKARQVQELKHTSPLLGCRFSPDGKSVYAGAQDNAVVRWELAGGKKTVLAGHKSWVRGLAFSAAAKLAYSGDYAGRVLAWALDGGSPGPRFAIDAHKGWVRALAVSPDGRLLATCGNDALVRLWSAADGRPLRELAGHDCHVYNVAFHPIEPLLVSADLKGVLKVWNIVKGTVERELEAKALHKYDAGFRADIGGARGMAFGPDGALLACAGITNVSNAFAGVGNPLVVLLDWKSGKHKQLLKPKAAFQGTGWGVVVHRDSFVLGVAGGNGGMLYAWKPEAAPDYFALKLKANARDLDLHPDGRRLAVAFHDGAVRVYTM